MVMDELTGKGQKSSILLDKSHPIDPSKVQQHGSHATPHTPHSVCSEAWPVPSGYCMACNSLCVPGPTVKCADGEQKDGTNEGEYSVSKSHRI